MERNCYSYPTGILRFCPGPAHGWRIGPLLGTVPSCSSSSGWGPRREIGHALWWWLVRRHDFSYLQQLRESVAECALTMEQSMFLWAAPTLRDESAGDDTSRPRSVANEISNIDCWLRIPRIPQQTETMSRYHPTAGSVSVGGLFDFDWAVNTRTGGYLSRFTGSTWLAILRIGQPTGRSDQLHWPARRIAVARRLLHSEKQMKR